MRNTITQEDIDRIKKDAVYKTFTIFDKCTVVACKLPNGFVIVESSACVDPANYDPHLGEQICKERILDKLWELEGYRLQQEVFEG